MPGRYRHAVITGASSGIGAALARELSAHGIAVTLVARRRALLDALADELPGPAHVAVCDLADLAAATDWLTEAAGELGPIDMLVNNAGLQVIGRTAEIDVARGEQSMAINLLAPLRLIRAVLPGMLQRGRGAIVNVASLAALAPTPRMAYYNASKAGIAAASESLRGELLDGPIDVVTVYPGIIETAMGKAGLAAYRQHWSLALQPRGTEAELARRMRRAVERGEARVIYPGVYRMARWLPGITRLIMDRFTPDLSD